MPQKPDQLSPELVEQILTKLGLSETPPVDCAGLTRLYRAWCQKVPFDNIRKRIHLTKNSPLPLPGYDDGEFFRGWLRYGVGGTCWAGNAALSALLEALGFSCERGVATMLTDSDQPPNHGTVCVLCDDKRFLVDASMLHNTPLLLKPQQPSEIDHPAWGLTCSPLKQLWSIRWRPLHLPEGCTCRIEAFSVTRKVFHRFNETSRNNSPFNDSLYIRLNTTESVIGISDGMSVIFAPTGEVIQKRLTHEEGLNLLVEQMAISEDIIARIPHQA
ncbi:MAG: arylamine N-acetyltransferase [Desulforhopalus sp.]